MWAAFTAYALAFLVTVVFNIPLNDELADTADGTTARERFEDPWVAWNVVRAVLSTLAAGGLTRGLVSYGRWQRTSVGPVGPVDPVDPVDPVASRPNGSGGPRA